MRAPWALALGVCALALCAQSCGYTTGLKVLEKHASVGLEIFGNDSYERDLERPLHDAISRSLRDLTDVPIERSDRAEVVIRGTIKTYNRRAGVRSPQNRLLETGVYIEVEATLFDRASGRALGPPDHVSQPIGFVLGDPDAERTARDRALRHIADQVVLDLFAPVD